MSLYRRKVTSIDPATGKRSVQAGRVWWFDFTVNGKRIRGSSGTDIKAEARQVEAKALQDAKAASAMPNRWRLRHMFGAYWEGRARHAKNADDLKAQMAAISDGLGPNLYVMDLTAEMLVAYLTRRRTGIRLVWEKVPAARRNGTRAERRQVERPYLRSNATLNRELAALRAAMNFAADAHGQPVPRINWKKIVLKEAAPRVRHLRQDEFQRLLECAADDEMALMIVLAIGSALRRQNLRDLDWAQVDLITGRIADITTKGGKNFQVRLSGDPLTRLQRHAAAVQKETGKLEGRVFTRPNWRRRWDATRNAAGIANYRWHDHRHTFGAWMRLAGVDIADIRDAMNHSSIAMTTRYMHITPEEATTAWDVMGKRLTPEAPQKAKGAAAPKPATREGE
jgi:integrase